MKKTLEKPPRHHLFDEPRDRPGAGAIAMRAISRLINRNRDLRNAQAEMHCAIEAPWDADDQGDHHPVRKKNGDEHDATAPGIS